MDKRVFFLFWLQGLINSFNILNVFSNQFKKTAQTAGA